MGRLCGAVHGVGGTSFGWSPAFLLAYRAQMLTPHVGNPGTPHTRPARCQQRRTTPRQAGSLGVLRMGQRVPHGPRECRCAGGDGHRHRPGYMLQTLEPSMGGGVDRACKINRLAVLAHTSARTQPNTTSPRHGASHSHVPRFSGSPCRLHLFPPTHPPVLSTHPSGRGHMYQRWSALTHIQSIHLRPELACCCCCCSALHLANPRSTPAGPGTLYQAQPPPSATPHDWHDAALQFAVPALNYSRTRPQIPVACKRGYAVSTYPVYTSRVCDALNFTTVTCWARPLGRVTINRAAAVGYMCQGATSNHHRAPSQVPAHAPATTSDLYTFIPTRPTQQ